MSKHDGKIRFWKIMFEDNLIDGDEFKLMCLYHKMKEEMDKETD